MGDGRMVLDTNIVLDLYLFDDPSVQVLRQAIDAASHRWLATRDMRDELERVLAYPRIVGALARRQIDAAAVLAQFDRFACLQAPPAPAGVRCRDPDDQKFLDLALAHGSALLSRDRALLELAGKLELLGVNALSATGFAA